MIQTMLPGDCLDSYLTPHALLNHIQLELRTMLSHRKTPKVGVQLSGFSSVSSGSFFFARTARAQSVTPYDAVVRIPLGVRTVTVNRPLRTLFVWQVVPFWVTSLIICTG